MNGKIAFFAPYHELMPHIIYMFLEEMAESGYDVDIFEYRELKKFPEHKYKNHRIRTIQLTEVKLKHDPCIIDYHYFVKDEMRRTIEKYAKQNVYDACIGLESCGFLFAYEASVMFRTKLVYYSIELYRVGDPNTWTNEEIAVLKELEKQLIPYADLFIIQDKAREDAFFNDLDFNLKRPPVMHLPVALSDSPPFKKERFWNKRFNIPADKTIILHCGCSWFQFTTLELVKKLSQLPDEYVSILHGRTYSPYPESIQEFLESGKLILSTDSYDISMLPEITAAADIGIVWYYEYYLNNYLTGSASTKLAYYLQAGLPVIAPDYPSYRPLYKQFKYGELIYNPEELPEALSRIRQNYSSCSKEAIKAYNHYFRLKPYIRDFIRYLKNNGLSPHDAEIQQKSKALEASKEFKRYINVKMLTEFIKIHIVSQWKLFSRNTEKIVLFGAGMHSRWLLEILKKNKLRMPHLIIDDNASENSIMGVPLLKPEDLNGVHPDLIILSSDVHQSRFRKRCEELFPTAELLDMYDGFPSGPYDKECDMLK